MEQTDLNKRLMLALVLSFGIMMGFSYLFPQAQPGLEANATASQTATDPKAAPQNPAPVSPASTSAPASPAVTGNATTAVSSHAPAALCTVSAKNFTLTIDRFGRINSTKLLEKKYATDKGESLELFDPKQIKPLELRFADGGLNAEAFKTPYTASSSHLDLNDQAQSVTLTQKLSGATVVKQMTFYPDGHYDLDVQVDNSVEYFITPGHRPEADHAKYLLVRGVLVRDAEGITTTVEDGDAEQSQSFANATILSAFDRYAASMFYRFETPFAVTLMPEGEQNALGFVSGKGTTNIHGYIGPKDYRTLQSLNPQLTDAIEFGWFTFLARPFFKVLVWIHDYVGNWGWAIVIFTILVKLILFPLSYKGMMSMQKMKDLAPKMKELKAKHKGDPAKLNQQTMELYKKHGANPMGGCLPLFLQFPVFFALYRVLLNADELQGAPWIGWITNLADKDPIYILPVVYGITMWLMQKIQPNTMTDPMQKKLMQWFPVMITFFFFTFPAGLVLYWLVNNILSIGQQIIINRAWEKHKANEKAHTHH